MLIQGVAGGGPLTTIGGNPSMAMGRSGSVWDSNYEPRFYQLCYANKTFSCSNQTVATLSTLSTTYTGNMVYNPVGSGVQLVLLQCAVAVASGAAAAQLSHQGNTAVQTARLTGLTALTVINNNLGSAIQGSGLAYSAATTTIVPVIVRNIGFGIPGASNISPGYVLDEINGALILNPGIFVGVGYVTAVLTAQVTYVWAELPL